MLADLNRNPDFGVGVGTARSSSRGPRPRTPPMMSSNTHSTSSSDMFPAVCTTGNRNRQGCRFEVKIPALVLHLSVSSPSSPPRHHTDVQLSAPFLVPAVTLGPQTSSSGSAWTGNHGQTMDLYFWTTQLGLPDHAWLSYLCVSESEFDSLSEI